MLLKKAVSLPPSSGLMKSHNCCMKGFVSSLTGLLAFVSAGAVVASGADFSGVGSVVVLVVRGVVICFCCGEAALAVGGVAFCCACSGRDCEEVGKVCSSFPMSTIGRNDCIVFFVAVGGFFPLFAVDSALFESQVFVFASTVVS